MPRVGLGLIIAVGVATGAWFAVFPGDDVAVSAHFFDAAADAFPASSEPAFRWLRERSQWIVIAIVSVAAAAPLLKLLVPSRPMLVPARVALFLVLTLALGPGLLVNGVLKPFSGRPRPVDTVQFGGAHQFAPWWNFSGTCPRNCSFVSGESAGAAWLVAPASLVPAPWRYPAMGAAATYAGGIGAMRIAFGRHYLSDVIFSGVFTILIVWFVHGWLFRWHPARGSQFDAAAESSLTESSAAICRWWAERRRRTQTTEAKSAERAVGQIVDPAPRAP